MGESMSTYDFNVSPNATFELEIDLSKVDEVIQKARMFERRRR